jgi:hypothetical protein
LVDLRNNGYSGNFNGNGALKTVCLSDNERARHGHVQMPVLREDLIRKSGWRVEGAAKIFKEQTSAIRTIITVWIPHVWWTLLNYLIFNFSIRFVLCPITPYFVNKNLRGRRADSLNLLIGA